MHLWLSGFLLPLFTILMSFFVQVASRFAFDDGRHVVVNPTSLTWHEAVSACNEMNGTLLTVYDAGTLVDIGIERKWIVWVGLRIEADDKKDTVKWNSGELATWYNWANHGGPPLGRELCTVAITTKPYFWTAVDCNTTWPSLCELHNGTCHFEVNRRSSLAGFNNGLLLNVDLETCRESCESSVTFFCLSFEYNSLRRFCQLSNTHRWNEQEQFASSDKEWDYYHRQCYSVYVNESWIPNGEIQITTEEHTTTLAVTTPTLPEVLSTEPDKDGLICVKITSLQPDDNQTEEINKEVKELQDLKAVYKDRRRSQSKESAKDSRPSARYVGTVAMSITLSMLLAIVILDLMTITRHRCPGRKAKQKQKANLKRRSFQDFANGRVVKLNPTWPSSVNVTLAEDHYSCPADVDDVEIRLNDVDISTTSQADIESFDLKAPDIFHETNSNSYVSWPYGKSSPVLFPFYRSKSERADRPQRSPNSLRVNKTEKYPRSKSDSFFNKRIYVLPETNSDWLAKRSGLTQSNSDWLTEGPGLTKTEQLVMAYGHHFDGDDGSKTFYRSLNVGKLRRGSHC